MNMDTVTLKFQSVVSKMKNDISDTISRYTKLGNTLNKVSNIMNKISNNSGMSNSFASTKQQIKNMEKELESLNSEYIKHSKIWKEKRLAGSSQAIYNPTVGTQNFDPNAVEVITQKKINEEKSRIDGLQAKINELKSTIEKPTKTPELIPRTLVPKTDEGTRKIKEMGNQTNNTSAKFKNAQSKARQMSNSFGSIGKSFKGIGDVFKNAGNNISKHMDKGLKSIKKFALGLVGVRTVMSLLTKSVNAYLSFDSDLQDSLNNSWNMLGSLLAPAIELVANLFATATNYIYRFVQALTGIDLVARANAKALQTQAKATQKTAAAQRGLLSMDEITNLPTESGGTPANQIKVGEIDTKGIFSDLLDAFKKHKWHRAGEIIAEGINKGLRSIQWDKVRERAEGMGRNIATFFNGIFELNWKLLGRSIANAINTAIDFAYGFVTEFEWGRVGVGIGDALTDFFKNFDFEKLADSINAFILGLYDMARGFIVHLDEEEMANSIIDFIERIKWEDIMVGLFEILARAIIKASKFIKTAVERLITDYYDEYLKPRFKIIGEALGDIMAGHFKSGFKKLFNVYIDGLNNIFYNIRLAITGIAKATGQKVTMNDVKIPHLATGTNDIESEGLYHLHEGEAVVPKKYNPATGGYDNSADNRQIIDLLISLNASMLEYADRPININMNSRKVAEATYDDLQQIDRNKNTSTAVVRS